MKRVMWASIATRNPMGQQVYEAAIQQALLATDAPDWEFRSVTVTSARSDIVGARRSLSGFSQQASFPAAMALGAAVYRTTDLVHRFDLRLPPHPGREVVTAHDLPAAHFSDEGALPRSIAQGARRARAVIVPSRFAADELEEHLGVRNAHVIPYGLSAEYVSPVPATNSVLESLGVGSPFVIHAAGATTRKNLDGLSRAWREIAANEPELNLVLCGPPNERRNDLFAGLPRVVMPGLLPAAVIAGLMCRAEVVVVPSLYEGFGLPALEGMACARPVVAARAGALPEVCDDAALLVEPTADGLAAGISKALHDETTKFKLIAAGPVRAKSFSWELAARRHLEVYAACS